MLVLLKSNTTGSNQYTVPNDIPIEVISPIRIVLSSLEDERWQCINTTDACIYTSQHAIRACLASPYADIFKEKLSYAVGSRTYGYLIKSGFSNVHIEYGIDAKTTAGIVLDDIYTNHKNIHNILHVCGDKRLNVLSEYINNQHNHNDHAISLSELICYETKSNPDIINDIHIKIEEYNIQQNDCWLVFFSPSGVHSVSESKRGVDMMRNCKIAAMGDTTGKAIEKLGMKVLKVAKQPNPKGLYEAFLTDD